MKKKKEKRPEDTPWQVTNMPMEVRIAAKKAADKSDVYLAQWLAPIIMEAAKKVISSKQEVMKQEDHIDISKIFEQLNKLSDKVDQMQQSKSGVIGRIFGR